MDAVKDQLVKTVAGLLRSEADLKKQVADLLERMARVEEHTQAPAKPSLFAKREKQEKK